MSSVFDPGKADRKKAGKKGDQAIIDGTDFSGPGGISGSFTFKDGVGTSTSSLGSFENALSGLQALTAQGVSQAQSDLPPELRALGDQTLGTLGQNDIQRTGNQSNFDGLGQVFDSAIQTASADPFAMGEIISGKLRALSERSNNRLVNKHFDKLKRSGKLSTSGGADLTAQLDANLFDEGLKFDLAGLDQGNSMIQQAFQRATGAAQGREAIATRNFGESMATNQFENQAALQQFATGNSMFDQFMAQQQQGAQMAFAANANAMNTAQLPLAFQAAAQNQATGSSNSLLASAGIDQQNAAMAKSPIMEMANMAISAASAMGPPS